MPSSSSSSSARASLGVTSSRSAGSRRRSRVAISSTSRSGRDDPDDAGQRLEVGAQPLELVDQRPRVLRVEQHQIGHRGHAHLAQRAPAVDHRRFARHQRRLRDRLLRTGGFGRGQRGTQQRRQPDARVRCVCRCPSSSSRRRAPSTRRPPRTAPACPARVWLCVDGQVRVALGLRIRRRLRTACSTARSTAASTIQVSLDIWSRTARADRPRRSTDCASEPGRCRSAVSDHSVVGAVADHLGVVAAGAGVGAGDLAQRGQQHRHALAAGHLAAVAVLVVPLAGDGEEPGHVLGALGVAADPEQIGQHARRADRPGEVLGVASRAGPPAGSAARVGLVPRTRSASHPDILGGNGIQLVGGVVPAPAGSRDRRSSARNRRAATR